MALLPSNPLVFTVRRQVPELVVPAKPTPHECKLLSDVDDQDGHRFQIQNIHFYRCNPKMQGEDPAKVIKQALAQTLVFYYPFAGRLREMPNRKLVVHCTGEGVLFIEADADVTLDDFGDMLYPPFPCMEELLYDVPGTSDLLNCPLLLIQVTRLKCGGFIFAYRLNHTMSDAFGLYQLMSTIGEIARGAGTPSIPPIWERHLLSARNPPSITCLHNEFDPIPTNATMIVRDNLVCRSFFFGTTQISALRKLVPNNLRSSTFDLISACIWRCRAKAVGYRPDEDVRLICTVNSRSRFNPPLPLGYYGNALGFPAAKATAGELCKNPLTYAIELVRQAKGRVTEEYMKSAADLLVIRGRPNVNLVGSLIVSDLTRSTFREVDFGWGEAVFAGPATFLEIISFYTPQKNKEGDDGLVVPVCLPAPAMESFIKELDDMFKDEPEAIGRKKSFIRNSL